MNNWLVDPSIYNIDCGDNSCRYTVRKSPGGMRTNGGCRCASNEGKKVEFFLSVNYREALKRIQELEGQLEIEKILQE